MMNRMRRKTVGILVAAALLFGGCGAGQEQGGMQDGSYTAQMPEYSHGWKEYITITVKNGEIIAVEYNAENQSGFVKSWDNAYMNNMKSITGTYPNEYTRYYASQLAGKNGMAEIDALSGATSSYGNFRKLAEAVVEQAVKGDSAIVLVEPNIVDN